MGVEVRQVIPALLIGVGMGYFLTLLISEPKSRPLIAQDAVVMEEADAEKEEDLSDTERSMARVCARACARESARAYSSSGSSSARASSAPARYPEREVDTDTQRAQLEDMMDLVLEHGLWSRGAGAKARRLLRGLPPQDAVALRRRIDDAAADGSIKIQTGTWLPSR